MRYTNNGKGLRLRLGLRCHPKKQSGISTVNYTGVKTSIVIEDSSKWKYIFKKVNFWIASKSVHDYLVYQYMTKRWRIVISTKRDLFLWGWELPWAIEKSSWGTETESEIHHLFQAFQISTYFQTLNCLNWSPRFSYAKKMKGSKKATRLVELLFCMRQGGGFNLEWSYAKAAIEPKIEQNWSKWRDVKIRSICDLKCHSKIDHSSKNHWVLLVAGSWLYSRHLIFRCLYFDIA